MLPFAAAAAATVAGQMAASYFGGEAAKDAARIASGAEREGLAFQKQTWDKTQQNIDPYLKAGTRGLSEYERIAGSAAQPEFNFSQPEFSFDVHRDPGADYQMSQATRALNNSSLAKGLTGGGAAKAIMAKNQEMAGTAYQGSWNRFMDKSKYEYTRESDKYKRNLEFQNLGLDRQQDLYKTGATLASGLGQIGNEASRQIGATYGNIGQTQAGGIIGANNAWQQGASNVMNTLGQGLGYYYGTPGRNPLQWDGRQTNTNLGAA